MNLQDVPDLTERHLEAQGLQGWTFAWTKGTSTFGVCRYSTKQIRVSKPMARVNSEERVERLILHEIAHALTPDDPGHGREWKAKCAEFGFPNEKRHWAFADTVQVPLRWTMTCPECGKEWHRRILPHGLRACPYHLPTRPNLIIWRTEDGPPRLLTEALAANRKETI